MSHGILNGIVVLVALGAAAQWLAWRLRVPSILLLLAVGFLAGPVTGLFRPEAVLGDLTFPFVSLAAAVVLFEGGLTASLDEFRSVAAPVRRLIVIGIPVTWLVLTSVAYFSLGVSLEVSLLLGAILVVTGPTVIGPLLRHAKPKPRVSSILKLEGIINDPIGAILAVLVFQGIQAEKVDRAFSVISFGILKAVVISTAAGLIGAWLFVKLLERRQLPNFLQNAVILPFVLVVYALANQAQTESGLLAVTVMGIAMASQDRVSMERSIEFTEHARVLLISALFILLTSRMTLPDVTSLNVGALVFVAAAILVARPLSVALSTFRSDLSWKERTFIASVAPRGVVAAAVSSLFSIELVETGYPDAAILLPLTFAVIAVTVLVYGAAASPLARWLGLRLEAPQGVLILGSDEVPLTIARAIQEKGFHVVVVDDNRAGVQAARSAGIEAHRGEIMSRRLQRRLNLTEIGHFLALTENRDLNTLAVAHFRKLVGDENVHQLQPSTEGGHPRPDYAEELQGIPFGAGATRDKLNTLIQAGAAITTIPMEDGLSLDALRKRFGQDAVPLFVVDEEDRLVFFEEEVSLPSAGKLVLLAP